MFRFVIDGFKDGKFLWSKLSFGTKWYNLATFYLAAALTISCYTFINSAQATVLSNFLGFDDLGKPTGDLGFYNELLIIATVTGWGVLSDKIGRKIVYSLGFFFMALGITAYPFATSFGLLVVYRLIFAVGASANAAMLTSVLSDYFAFEDKGTASGFMGLFSGCGALISVLFFLQISSWLPYEVEPATKVMFVTVGIIMSVVSLIMLVGLQGKTDIQEENQTAGYVQLFVEGFGSVKNDKRLLLAYLAGFVARGDAVVLTTFLSLWIQDYAIERGDLEDDALALAGQITGIAQTFALIAALPCGYICTKIDSALSMLILSCIAMVGYTSMSFIKDPTGTSGMALACIIGIGEIGVIIGAQNLVSKHSPRKIRGAIGGAFGLCGSVGILICTKLGGYLYDNYTKSGPFILFSGFNFILILSSVVIYYLTRHNPHPSFLREEIQKEGQRSEASQPLLPDA